MNSSGKQLKEYTLILAEKPRAAERIATALSSGRAIKTKHGKISYYVLERASKKIVIAPAVGHLYTLQQEPGHYDYPIFEVRWVPTYEASTHASYSKPYADTIKFLSKDASEFVSACDYDIEGSLIGANVLRFICGETAFKNAKRMKFSALTQSELEKAYETRMEHLDFNLIEAGITRHLLDYYWGINSSRALSHAYKSLTGRYVTLSAGRVQTPTLKILDDREQEIKKFVPEPFWVISALLETAEGDLLVMHELEQFFKKEEALNVYDACKGEENAIVLEISKRKIIQNPPFPFNLGDLQGEAYKIFKYSPKMTQQLAQSLYEQGVCTYPRTSSQKLPKGMDTRKLIKKLSAQARYTKLAKELLEEKELKANEGPKTDEAHPAIIPTGTVPKKLTPQEDKLYDLIVKRFFACFGKPAIRETQNINFKIDGEKFFASGIRTLEENWHLLYKPYVRLKEEELPHLEEGQSLKIKELNNDEKETQPPKRYSQAGIIKKMEQLGIGTKATRSQILQTLYDRNYITGTQIQVTEFGSKIIETIAKHVPELTSEELTRKFEDEMEQIREGKKKKEIVIDEAKETITKTSDKFKSEITEISKELVESHRESEKQRKTVCPCPKCGKDLVIRVSRASGKQFIGCSGYPNCTCSYPLPQNASITVTKKTCEHDNLPIIEVRRRGKRKFTMCISNTCKSKESWGKPKSKQKKAKKKSNA